MTAREIVQAAHAEGVFLSLWGPDRILIKPPGVLSGAVRQAMQARREELLTLLEAFEERAAIAQSCAGVPRHEAEALAWACVLSEPAHGGCAACGLPDSASAHS